MSVGRSKKKSTSSTSSVEGSPTEFQSRLRAPDNFSSALPASRSVSTSSLNYLAQTAAAEPIAPTSKPFTSTPPRTPEKLPKEKRDRKRSFRLSTSADGSSPGARFARGMKRVSSAFKTGSSSTTSEARSEESDMESRRSASTASSAVSESPPLESVAQFQPPETPKAAANNQPGASPHEQSLGASSYLVLNPTSEAAAAPAKTSPQPTSPSSPATPLAEQQPYTMTSPKFSAPPASVGFPEVDQIGDKVPAPVVSLSDEQPEPVLVAAEDETPAPASTDYPPVDTLLKEQREQERELVAQESSDDDGADSEKEDPTPSHSLTVSAWRAFLNPRTYSMSISTRRKVYLVVGSLAINLLLPFVNGVMLGLGEIFARESIAIYFGLGPKASAGNGPQPARANVGQVGLRAAGENGGGNVKPGKPAAKTAAEVAGDAVKRL